MVFLDLSQLLLYQLFVEKYYDGQLKNSTIVTKNNCNYLSKLSVLKMTYFIHALLSYWSFVTKYTLKLSKRVCFTNFTFINTLKLLTVMEVSSSNCTFQSNDLNFEAVFAILSDFLVKFTFHSLFVY